jgi:hypothetical protein
VETSEIGPEEKLKLLQRLDRYAIGTARTSGGSASAAEKSSAASKSN